MRSSVVNSRFFENGRPFKETLALLTQVVEEEKIDCDLWRGRGFGSQEVLHSMQFMPLKSRLPLSRCCIEPTMRRRLLRSARGIRCRWRSSRRRDRMDLGPARGKTTDSVRVRSCGSDVPHRFFLALQVCHFPPAALYRQVLPEPADQHPSVIRLPVWRWRLDRRDGAWFGQGGQSGVCDERIYPDSFARVHRQNRSRSGTMLSGDPDQVILGRETSDARVFAQMEDGR